MSDKLFDQVETRYRSIVAGLETELQRASASIDALDLYACSQPDEEELIRLFSQIIESFDENVRNIMPDNFHSSAFSDPGNRRKMS